MIDKNNPAKVEVNPRTFQARDGYWWSRVGADNILGPYETQLQAQHGYEQYLKTFDLTKANGVWA